MKLKTIFVLALACIILQSCGVNNIAWTANSNIKKLELGMTKEEVIKILGNKYMISASSLNQQGIPVEVLGYKSDVDEEYNLHFENNKLVEWKREHVIKHVVKE